jgi:peptidoglycan hydrolase-like protein with peptidoglycan-binding domain
LWGRYYWHPFWGWYHTALVTGATLAFIDSLPNSGSNCEEAEYEGEIFYVCDGVVYRSASYKDKKVYEVVSSDQDARQAKAPTIVTENDEFVELKLASPYLQGERVRNLQSALAGIGFSVGSIDGVFGQGTDEAVREFQKWYGLPVTGVVDVATANAIAAEYAATLAPPTENAGTLTVRSAEDQTDESDSGGDSGSVNNNEGD